MSYGLLQYGVLALIYNSTQTRIISAVLSVCAILGFWFAVIGLFSFAFQSGSPKLGSFIAVCLASFMLVDGVKCCYLLLNYLANINKRIEVSAHGLKVIGSATDKVYVWNNIKRFKRVYWGLFWYAHDRDNEFIFVVSRFTQHYRLLCNSAELMEINRRQH